MGLLELLIAILLIGWMCGMIGGYAYGGLIHLLLVLAAIVLALRLWRGTPPV